MRSLALAEAAVAAGHEVVVVGRFKGEFLQGQLAAAPVEVFQLPAREPDADGDPLDVEVIERLGTPDVLHVDSYETNGWFMGSFVLSNMEDGTFGRGSADVVIDPTLGAELSARPEDGSRWLLRGSRYTPLRRRVIDARTGDDLAGKDGVAKVARAVLVVMGGTDPIGLAPAAVALLALTGLELEVTVIAVGENAERARAAAQGSRLSLRVLAPVDDLAALMSRQDLVVSAAGTSVWELCCIGVPAAVVWTVDNQREGYNRVVEAGAAVGLGGPDLGSDDGVADLLKAALTDSRRRLALVLAGRQVVDGLGAWRVVRAWEMAHRQGSRRERSLGSGSALGPGASDADASDADASALVLRPATVQDARQLWLWRNDPVTRAGSRLSTEVSWEDHLGWLTASFSRRDRILLMAEDAVGAVGTVRWDLVTASEGERAGDHREWEVSITVAPQRRGQSLARPLLRAGEVVLSERMRSLGSGVTAYLAVVHLDNAGSVRLFETSGYGPDLPPDPRGFMRYRKVARVL
jgi:spore coat polysaccharide biosynthesis predicted glycosyltransferase SpsG/ribosomal protein S18 acetylase RimI-like enzyme